MSARLIKLLLVIGGLILVWVAVYLIWGVSRVPVAKPALEFWGVFDKSDTIKPLLKKFTNQTGISVNYRVFSDLDDYRETLLIELAAKEGPDIFMVHNSWIPKYRDLLQPLPLEFLVTPESVRQNFVDAVAEGLVLEKNDAKTLERKKKEKDFIPGEDIVGLPMYVDSLGIYYNKEIFRNVLTKSFPAPATTWQGIKQDVIKLNRPTTADPEGFKLSGIALGRTDNISRGLDVFYNLYAQFGGTNLTNAIAEKGRDDQGRSYEPLAAALNFFASFSRNTNLQEYAWNSEMGLGAPEKELNAFVRGKVAMIFGYSYYYETIKSLIEQSSRRGISGSINLSDVEIAPFPQIFDPSEGEPKVVLADYFALAVPKTSKYPSEAWQVILQLTSSESESEYIKTTKRPPSRRELLNQRRSDLLYGTFADQAVYATVLPILDFEKYDAAMRDATNLIADGAITVEDALRTLHIVLKAPLKKEQ